MPSEVYPTGPFDGEPQVELPEKVRHVIGGHHDWNCRRLKAALAGVEVGAYDLRIVDWLFNWEPSTVAVIADWISRAKEVGRNVH